MSTSFLLAGTLIVKDSDVTVSINAKNEILKEGTSKEFLDGSTICYVSGSGRIIVNSSIQLTSKIDQCIQTKISSNNNFKTLLASLKNSLIVSFTNTNEISVDGVSSKGSNDDKSVSIINIDSTIDFLVIESKSSGPLPITLYVLDDNNRAIKKIINKENCDTYFILNISNLKNNYKISIKNGFGIEVKNIVLKK